LQYKSQYTGLSIAATVCCIWFDIIALGVLLWARI